MAIFKVLVNAEEPHYTTYVNAKSPEEAEAKLAILRSRGKLSYEAREIKATTRYYKGKQTEEMLKIANSIDKSLATHIGSLLYNEECIRDIAHFQSVISKKSKSAHKEN